jgi:hypothetical protein
VLQLQDGRLVRHSDRDAGAFGHGPPPGTVRRSGS